LIQGFADIANALNPGSVGFNFEASDISADVDENIAALQRLLDDSSTVYGLQVQSAKQARTATEAQIQADELLIGINNQKTEEVNASLVRIFEARQNSLLDELDATNLTSQAKQKLLSQELAQTEANLVLQLTKVGIERTAAEEIVRIARERAAYEISEQRRIDAAYAAARGIVMNYVENGLMELNTALIEGELTFKSIAKGFRDMLGSMLREIQSAVFRQTIAAPIAEFVGGLFAAGGRVHLAGGGSMKRDRVAAMLEPGEYVIRKEAAKKLGMSKLQELNAGVSDDPIARIIAYAYGSKVKRKANGGSINDPTIDDIKNMYGAGNRGIDPFGFIPGIGTLYRLMGLDAGVRIGASEAPVLNDAQLRDFNKEAIRKDGTRLTRMIGNQPGDYIPAGPSGSYFSSAGRGLIESPFGTGEQFSALTPQGTSYFTGYKATYNAVMDGAGFSVRPFGATERFAAANRGVFGQAPDRSPADRYGVAGGGPRSDFRGGDSFENTYRASGGMITRMASGGMMRDRVPALLEPGEFVIRRPAAKAIGGAALGAMNATGKATPNIAVNVNNQGTPKDVAVAPPKMNGDKIILDIITRDLRNNGAIKKTLRRGK